MSCNAKTTWDDLAKLGWSKQTIFDIINAESEGTVTDINKLYLNEGIAIVSGRSCCNALKGDVHRFVPYGNTLIGDKIVWEYDNTNGTEAHTEQWTEKWTDTVKASLEISKPALIPLNDTILITRVCNTELDFVISTEATDKLTEEDETSHVKELTITVAPGEKVQIILTRSEGTYAQQFDQKYGLDDANDFLVSYGELWNGSRTWAWPLNRILGNPSGMMSLLGTAKTTTSTYRIHRQLADGGAIVRTIGPKPSTVKTASGGVKQAAAQKIQGQVPVALKGAEGAEM
ncbi:TEER-decreasing protein [Daedaleopsis nitida]|nr:TEER-decreasing protein [Daedaleopsis nitida]